MFKRKYCKKQSELISKVRRGFTAFSLLFLIIFAFSAYAQINTARGATELSFVLISFECPDLSNYPVVDEYQNRIINYFRFPPTQAKSYSAKISDSNEGVGTVSLAVGFEAAFAQADSGFKVTFTKNDAPSQQVPSYLTLAYGIAVDPPEGEDQPSPGEATPRKNEWINVGGEIGSPPIVNVSKDFISNLCDKGQEKYWHSIYFKNYDFNDIDERIRESLSYPPYYDLFKNVFKKMLPLSRNSDKYCTITDREGYVSTKGTNNCAILPHKKFETAVEKITSIPSTYVAENGYPAYVIPLAGLKTEAYGGVQFFRAVDGSIQCKISCYGPLSKAKTQVYEIPIHKKTINGKEQYYIDLEEASKSCTNKPNVNPYVGCYDIGSVHFVYIDKLFFPDTMESVQADWLIRLYKDGNANQAPQLIFEMPLIIASGTSPEVSFDYEIESITGEEVIVKLKPQASDPDGKVESITWDFGNGEQQVSKTLDELLYSFVPGYYTVSLTAYDNSGLKSKKIRTLNLSLGKP